MTTKHAVLLVATLALPACLATPEAPVSLTQAAIEGTCTGDYDLDSVLGEDVARDFATTTQGQGTDHASDPNLSCSWAVNGTAAAQDVSFVWTAPSDGTFGFSLYDTGNWDMMTFLRNCAGTEIACVDYPDRVQATLAAGESITLVVDGWYSTNGPFKLRIVKLACGDKTCADDFENVFSCPADCVRCGDNICSSGAGEDSGTCHADCHCGDGKPEADLGEQCDDGDSDDTDECSTSCKSQSCGDGITQYNRGEQCDDGNTDGTDMCSAECKYTYCGDGIKQPVWGEACDDGNNLPDDGCNFCQLDFCGNGIVEPEYNEDCDDANYTPHDGCSSSCKLDYCGNNVRDIDQGEECDGTDVLPGMTCGATCRWVRCGDGIVQSSRGEECDGGEQCGSDCTLKVRSALMFPFVTNQGGFDTAIVLTNPSSDGGACTLLFRVTGWHFNGLYWEYGPHAESQSLPLIPSGRITTLLLSNVKPGTAGSVLALCDFPRAEGYNFLSDLGARNLAGGFLAEKLPLPVFPRRENRQLWFPAVEWSAGEADTGIAISNTSADEHGLPEQPIKCRLTYRDGAGALRPEEVTPIILPGATQVFLLSSTPEASQKTSLVVDCYPVNAITGEEIEEGTVPVSVDGSAFIVDPFANSFMTAYRAEKPAPSHPPTTELLFSRVSVGPALDTVVSIANPADGATGHTCTVVYGDHLDAVLPPIDVPNGGLASYVVRDENPHIPPTSASIWSGSVRLSCDFPGAWGLAFIDDQSQGGGGSPMRKGTSIVAEPMPPESETNNVLFPFVSNQAGFDTAIAIRNVGETAGGCKLRYSGALANDTPVSELEPISEVAPGGEVTLLVSSGGTHGAPAHATFQGYVEAVCDFQARGLAVIADNQGRLADAYSGVSSPRPTAVCKPSATIDTLPGVCSANLYDAAGAVVSAAFVDGGTYEPNREDAVLTLKQTPNLYYPGENPVTLLVSDAEGRSAFCQSTVIVEDHEQPHIACPASSTTEGTSPAGAAITFATSATDNCEEVTFECTPPSGTVLAIGETTIACTATDGAGNTADCGFTATVADSTPPTVTCPADVTVEAASAAGSAVVLAATTADVVTPEPELSYQPASGSLFPIGTTPVTVTATDGAGNHASCNVNVTVVDTTPPIVTCPADLTVEATSAAGSAVVLAAAAADVVTAAPAISYEPANGSVFPLGTTPVTVTATDGAGNHASCTVKVTVVDRTPPIVICPAAITVEATSPSGSTVVLAATAADAVTAAPALAYQPASGSVFALGTTKVTVTATDDAGNHASCGVDVTVVDTTAPVFDGASLAARTLVGSCAGAPAAFVAPTATDAAWSQVSVTCVPLSGDRFGANLVDCTATDGAGNTTHATLTVSLLQPLGVELLQPLSRTAINRFAIGQTLPHKVRLLDCNRSDVTTSVPAKVRLAVTAGVDGTGANLVNDANDYSVIGNPSGLMTLVNGHYHFDLLANPADYAPGGKPYLSTMTAAYDVAPALAAGVATARLQSK